MNTIFDLLAAIMIGSAVGALLGGLVGIISLVLR